MNKQTHFESSDALENAAVMLDVCRTEFERAGHGAAAQSLRGLDVTSPVSAQLALMTVHALPKVEGLVDMRQCAIETMQRAFAAFRYPIRLAS